MFPFMRSKADRLECTGSDQDRKYYFVFDLLF